VPQAQRAVALLRGINVGGKNLLPMPALASALEDAGLVAVETYIQSGNVFFDATADRGSLEQLVERVVQERFGLRIPTLVRRSEDWRRILKGAPFADAQRDRPKLLHVGHAKHPFAPGMSAALAQRATHEVVAVHQEALFVDFGHGAGGERGSPRRAPHGAKRADSAPATGLGRSKLTPAALDKAAGSPVTLRNWNTTLEIARRLGLV
jgi:uncharacterized protein (DUF1697 family)